MGFINQRLKIYIIKPNKVYSEKCLFKNRHPFLQYKNILYLQTVSLGRQSQMQLNKENHKMYLLLKFTRSDKDIKLLLFITEPGKSISIDIKRQPTITHA